MSKWLPANTTRRTCLAAGLLAAQVASGPVHAQTPDNGVLAQIFSEPVTSSATGRPQLVSEAPANIEIITQDDIRRSGATTIPDALAFLPGVYVRRYGISDVEVGIRGYDQPLNPRLLVLVNGREVFDQSHGFVPWAEIPVQLDEIRQIEVIKGPNSALYGFNAVGGVINIITYDPLADNVDAVTLRGGTQSYLSGSAVGTAKIGDAAAVRLSTGGMVAKDFAPGQLNALDAAARQNPRIATFNIEAKAKPFSGVEAFIEASIADSRYAEEDVTGTFDTTFRRTNSLRAGGSVETPLGLLSLSAYRDETLQSLSAGLRDTTGDWFRRDTYVVQTSLLMKPASNHTVRIGLEYRNNASLAPYIVGGTIGYQVYAASAMWNWQILPSLALTTAVRNDFLLLNYSGIPAPGSGFSVADYNKASVSAVSFNTGLVYQATEQDTLRLMVARGVMLPSLLDFGQQVPFGTYGPVIVAGSPTVRPTIVHNLELDYDRALPGNTTLRTAVFAQRSDDVISPPLASGVQFSPSGVPLLLATNVGSTAAFGGEIGLKGETQAGLRWGLSYALVSTTNHTTVNQGAVLTTPINYGLSVPRHVVDANIGYTWERVEMDLQGRWQSSYLDYRPTGVAYYLEPVEARNYVTVNGRAGYKLTDNVTLAVTAQQMNNSRLYQTAGPPIERRLIASMTAKF